ncbi:hypothetical protein ABO04_10010 [Nitrosomonas sp. HPC101]|nr:hypothetical protein [Nitrosomonas sp. HPC101]
MPFNADAGFSVPYRPLFNCGLNILHHTSRDTVKYLFNRLFWDRQNRKIQQTVVMRLFAVAGKPTSDMASKFSMVILREICSCIINIKQF